MTKDGRFLKATIDLIEPTGILAGWPSQVP